MNTTTEKKNHTEKESEQERLRLSGMIIAMAVLFIVIGLALIFLIPEYITLVQICYLLDLAVLGCGIFLIVRYFLKEYYKNLQEYSFSIGTMLVLVGAIALVRASVMSEYFILALGVLMLVAAVFKLQTALDLNALHDKSFWLWICIAAAFTVLAVVTVMNPFKATEALTSFVQYVLVADGLVSLISALYLYFRVRAAKKQENNKADPDPSQEEPQPGTVEMPDDSGL